MKKLVFLFSALLLLGASSYSAERVDTPVSHTGNSVELESGGCSLLFADFGITSTGTAGPVSVHWLLQSTGAYTAVLRDSDTANTSSALAYQVQNSSGNNINFTKFKFPLEMKNGLSLNSSNTLGAVAACITYHSTTTLYSIDLPVDWAGSDLSVDDAGCMLTQVNGHANGAATTISTTAFIGNGVPSSAQGTLIYSVDIDTSTSGVTNYVTLQSSFTNSSATPRLMPPINGGDSPATQLQPFGKKLVFDPPARAPNKVTVSPSNANNGPKVFVCTRGRKRD